MKEFVCPGPGSDDELICEFFANGTHFCPYSAMAIMRERNLFPDCPHAPKEIWKVFKNLDERKEYYEETQN